MTSHAYLRRWPIRKLLTNVSQPESHVERDAAWDEIERRDDERGRFREALLEIETNLDRDVMQMIAHRALAAVGEE